MPPLTKKTSFAYRFLYKIEIHATNNNANSPAKVYHLQSYNYNHITVQLLVHAEGRRTPDKDDVVATTQWIKLFICFSARHTDATQTTIKTLKIRIPANRLVHTLNRWKELCIYMYRGKGELETMRKQPHPTNGHWHSPSQQWTNMYIPTYILLYIYEYIPICIWNFNKTWHWMNPWCHCRLWNMLLLLLSSVLSIPKTTIIDSKSYFHFSYKFRELLSKKAPLSSTS